MVDPTIIDTVVTEHWSAALPVLEDYIRIPAKSPAFDADWEANGHIEAAVQLIKGWCDDRAPAGATVEVQRLPGRTPVIVVEVPATGTDDADDTVLLYGHLDKQPEMEGWYEGLGPWTPVVRDDRLYGRGGGDDGYAAFAVMSAVDAVVKAGGAHHRCLALIEASEESGSPDLPAHLDALRDRLGQVSLVLCLDSGAPNYDALWTTTSLRGLLSVSLRVDVLERGLHSGIAGGAAPSSMRVLRLLLDRIEDARTGKLLPSGFHVEVPPGRLVEAEAAAAAGVDPRSHIPFFGVTRSDAESAQDAILNTCWQPSLAYIGIDGVPALADAGNVLRPQTTLGLSFRLPPTCDPDDAIAGLRAAIETDPPLGATVTLTVHESAIGWDAPSTEPWLEQALHEASTEFFGAPPGAWGLGGSIPFMAMLGDQYPDAQFVITGVLGPESNAHGPNEFLDLPTARRVSACMAHVLDAHARRSRA